MFYIRNIFYVIKYILMYFVCDGKKPFIDFCSQGSKIISYCIYWFIICW